MSQMSERNRVRMRILQDHLQQIANNRPRNESAQVVEEGLTYAFAISLLDEKHESDNGGERRVSGGISETDLRRYGTPLQPRSDQYDLAISNELKSALFSILDYWSDADQVSSEAQRLKRAARIPVEIRSRRQELKQQASNSREQRTRIQQLVEEVNDVHPRLEEDLRTALLTLPSIINASRDAEADALALSIETSLLKLSLFRARTHLALYSHTSPTDPRATMSEALSAVQAHLQEKAREQAEEEARLDEAIGEYEAVMSLVERGGGGYKQVVEDMARVKRETEECRKDLRRLGWTGT